MYNYAVTSYRIPFPVRESPISSVYFTVLDTFISLHSFYIQNDFAVIMKKDRFSTSKKRKTKTTTKPKKVIELGEDLPSFSAVSRVDLENLNLSIITNIRDLLTSLV